MTQREALNDDQKKLNWLLGLEKETLADIALQQSKIIKKLQKAAKSEENADVVGAINVLRAGHARLACEVSGAAMPPAAGTRRSESGVYA